ncbi:MAG: ATPase domain-containing protein [Promethearchaeota archaeon]
MITKSLKIIMAFSINTKNEILPKVPTGITGLDDALQGGFPNKAVCIISGGPGCGKTLLGAEFLYNGITKYNEPGIYISLGESKEEFFMNTRAFGWNFEELEKEGKFAFVDFSFEKLVNIWSTRPAGNFDMPEYSQLDGLTVEEQTYILMMQNFTNSMIDAVQNFSAKRIVIDPISSLRLIFPTEFISRRELLRIFTVLREMNTTTIVISELPKEEGFSVEEFVGSGVIRLSYSKSSGAMEMNRKLVIYKMRGTAFNEKMLAMRISKNGVEILGESLGFS